MTTSPKIPSPADVPQFTARQLLRKIRREGGRVLRMREGAVFCLTQSEELAAWLIDRGGKPYAPVGGKPSYTRPLGGYELADGDGLVEWDIYLHTIPVREGQTVWEAAGSTEIVEATEYR